MIDNKYDTLSEKLFAPHIVQKETSKLLNTNYPFTDLSGSWYRNFSQAEWHWFDITSIEQEEILSVIAKNAAQSDKLHNNWLDTIPGYQEGAWTYEWTKVAMEYQKKALNLSATDDKKKIFELWHKASLFYTIASYPNIKTDQIALQAVSLAYNAHQKSLEYRSFSCKQIEIRDQHKTIKGYLYLPHTNHPVPLLFYCLAQDQRHTLFSAFCNRVLSDLNIGFFIMDPCAVGDHADWSIDNNDLSYIHGLMLAHLSTLSWIDERNIFIIGNRLGGNIAIRLAYTHAKYLKAAITLNGYLHSIFYSENYPDNKMTYDLYTSLFGLQSASPSLLMGKLQYSSLKTQGLLGHSKAKIPILAIKTKKHPYSSIEDDKLCAQCSIMGKSIVINEQSLYQDYNAMITEVINYLKAHVSFDY